MLASKEIIVDNYEVLELNTLLPNVDHGNVGSRTVLRNVVAPCVQRSGYNGKATRWRLRLDTMMMSAIKTDQYVFEESEPSDMYKRFLELIGLCASRAPAFNVQENTRFGQELRALRDPSEEEQLVLMYGGRKMTDWPTGRLRLDSLRTCKAQQSYAAFWFYLIHKLGLEPKRIVEGGEVVGKKTVNQVFNGLLRNLINYSPRGRGRWTHFDQLTAVLGSRVTLSNWLMTSSQIFVDVRTLARMVVAFETSSNDEQKALIAREWIPTCMYSCNVAPTTPLKMLNAKGGDFSVTTNPRAITKSDDISSEYAKDFGWDGISDCPRRGLYDGMRVHWCDDVVATHERLTSRRGRKQYAYHVATDQEGHVREYPDVRVNVRVPDTEHVVDGTPLEMEVATLACAVFWQSHIVRNSEDITTFYLSSFDGMFPRPLSYVYERLSPYYKMILVLAFTVRMQCTIPAELWKAWYGNYIVEYSDESGRIDYKYCWKFIHDTVSVLLRDNAPWEQYPCMALVNSLAKQFVEDDCVPITARMSALLDEHPNIARVKTCILKPNDKVVMRLARPRYRYTVLHETTCVTDYLERCYATLKAASSTDTGFELLIVCLVGFTHSGEIRDLDDIMPRDVMLMNYPCQICKHGGASYIGPANFIIDAWPHHLDIRASPLGGYPSDGRPAICFTGLTPETMGLERSHELGV